MRHSALHAFVSLAVFLWLSVAQGQIAEKVIDIPTREGITERSLVLSPRAPKAAAILFAGGHGGLQIRPNGSMLWGEGNFLVRARQMFADKGIFTVVIDAPSDHLSLPYLSGFRMKPEHAADVRAIIAWIREQANVPVWLIGTSRGTQSAAYAALQLQQDGGPDGLVLTSTVLTDKKTRPVTAMPIGKLQIPVLVVHHEQDGCEHCAFSEIPALMEKLQHTPKSQLISVTGGKSEGDPCDAFAYHGYNGIEQNVVTQIADWMLQNQ